MCPSGHVRLAAGAGRESRPEFRMGLLNVRRQQFARRIAVPAGRIKKIIPDRGFGFVRADDGNEVFFHRTELTTVDFDTLQEGEEVTFDIVDSPKGPRARNLQKVAV